MKNIIGPILLVALIISVAVIVIKQQNKSTPAVQGCPPGSTSVVLTDGTVNCSVAEVEPSK